MSSNPMDALLLMSDVKFDKLTVEQTQKLALSVGAMNDACEFRNSMLSGLRAALSSLGAATVGGITLYFVDRAHTFQGIIGGLTVCVIVEAMNYWRASSSVEDAINDLSIEIDQLNTKQE